MNPQLLPHRASLLFTLLIVSPLFAQRAASRPVPVDVPVSELGGEFRLMGRTGVPLGEIVIVRGVVIDGPFKGYEGGPNVCIQCVNGRTTQEHARVPLHACFGRFGEGELPQLVTGEAYEFEGYETGGYIGVPLEALKRTGQMIQTSDHYFRTDLVVYRAKAIPKIIASPADFVDRVALMAGMAVSEKTTAWIRGESWMLLVDPNAAWPGGVEGKSVEGFGTIRTGSAKDRFRLENGQTRLVRLEDQLGQTVRLRGTACSLNGKWWFDYRGVEMYVENMEKLPGWSGDLHYAPVEITGTLERAKLPRIDQITEKADRDEADYFIIRKPSWKRIDALLSPERANGP